MTIRKALIFGLLLEILIGCLAGAFYFKFYIYTPTYSIRAMQKAMETGNVEALKQRVDLDGIFKQNNARLAGLVAKNDPAYGKVADGSFATYCEDDFLKYIQGGKWQDRNEVTPESALEDMIGLRTTSFRGLEYVYRDPPPGQEEVNEQSNLDKLLTFGMSLINKYGPGKDEITAQEEAKAAQEADTDTTITAGIRVYEPNFGDTFLLKLKLRRQEDGSWYLYDIENYQEFAGQLLKQNERDFIRYKEKVRTILITTQEKLDELKNEHPNQDTDWLIGVRNIMDESNKQIDDLKVPVAGGYLNQLLKERKELYLDLLDSYYDLSAETDSMNDARELAQNATEKKKKRPVYNEAVWNERLTKANSKIAEAQKNWADNKAKLEAAVGSVVDRAAVAQTVAVVLRNNDDEFVKSVNYPAQGINGGGAGVPSLLDDGNLPTISAYGQLNK